MYGMRLDVSDVSIANSFHYVTNLSYTYSVLNTLFEHLLEFLKTVKAAW
jgi:hypothetical protein